VRIGPPRIPTELLKRVGHGGSEGNRRQHVSFPTTELVPSLSAGNSESRVKGLGVASDQRSK
jgi:hypothetical protein